MRDLVKIVECPRDAWQGLPQTIPAEVKAAYLRKLVEAGFRHIDAVSFVSPKAVPQMADSEDVLALLGSPANVDIIGIVVNEKGAQRAIRTGAVQTLGFPYSISPQFLLRNQNQTPEQALDALDAIANEAARAGIDLVAYLSMAFGNPYGESWDIDDVIAGCELLIESGVHSISLADTAGVGSKERIGETVRAVLEAYSGTEIGVHLHAHPGDAVSRIVAAYQAGCRRFDSAIGGLGGCPFAQDVLVGNISTEKLIEALNEIGATFPPLAPLGQVSSVNAEIARRFGAVVH